MNALKFQAKIKDGQLDLPPLDLPEGTVIEAILLIQDIASTDQDIMDETEYLLATPANHEHLKKSIAQYQQGKVFERDLIADE